MESRQNLGADLRRVVKKYGYNKALDIELGTILSVNPISIAVDGVDDVLEANEVKVAQQLINRTVSVSIAGIPTDIDYPMQLEEADRVVLIYDVDRGFFFIIDKVIDGEDI